MERKIAELVVKSLSEHNGPMLSILEAMSMTKINSDERTVYVVQKGDVTFLAWIYLDTTVTYVRTKIVCW